ncbi:hypothetical protein J3Q64DRAFT_1161923 [Phycomyces blakesleeanus]|uniref:Uncharacterized protein n=1 Tax=Phycomyces blakesleeanus TaxID=4837 RepID=A0ABR3ATV5_PHYBL
MPILSTSHPFSSSHAIPSLHHSSGVSWEDDSYRVIGQKQKPFVLLPPHRKQSGFSQTIENTLSRLQTYSFHNYQDTTLIPSSLELSASSSSSSLDSFSSTDTTIYVSPVHPKPLTWTHASPHSVKEPLKGKGLATNYHKYTPARLPTAPTRNKYPFEDSAIFHVSRYRNSSAKRLDPLLTQSSECLSLDEDEDPVFANGHYRQRRFNYIYKN